MLFAIRHKGFSYIALLFLLILATAACSKLPEQKSPPVEKNETTTSAPANTQVSSPVASPAEPNPTHTEFPTKPPSTATRTFPPPTATEPGEAAIEIPPPEGLPFILQDPPIYNEALIMIKERLGQMGYEICTDPWGMNSDIYSAQTAYALTQFQIANSLTADGILGPETWRALSGTSPIPAPALQVETHHFEDVFQISSANGLTAIDGLLWVYSQGFNSVDVFDPFSSELLVGMYTLNSLPGEEAYSLSAATSDGENLWVAAVGNTDALVQMYSVADANPIDRQLHPALSQSIHFNALFIRGLAFGSGRIWVSVEGAAGINIVEIDPQKGVVESILFFNTEYFPNQAAFDTANQVL
ncbi:MAG: peptidoglycan-binding protein [Anaerolineaceae bacterium]|nr:peptidoglycan-binding protein [Anaerolineaceae bacterium]